MDITVMYFCGCSGWQAAEANLFAALAALRMPDASFCRRLIATVEEAERCPVHRFANRSSRRRRPIHRTRAVTWAVLPSLHHQAYGTANAPA